MLSKQVRDDTKRLLASALYSNNRVINSRYGTLSISADRFLLWHSDFQLVYRCAEGSMLFIDLSELVDRAEGDIVDGAIQILEGICSRLSEEKSLEKERSGR